MILKLLRAYLSPMKVLTATSLIICLSGCSTSTRLSDSAAQPEPVLIVYHVKPGAEQALEDVLKRAWEIYRSERLVFDKPHVCVRVKEDAEKIRFVEMFTWVSYFATEHPPDSVKKIWDQLQSLCEDRGGNTGVEVRQAEILTP
ncbi:MAG TPA: hypothetical protein PKN95_12780 [Verrucomicrobiota bacterium]|nr:hypothetical protein [Verrucomicrobiota bacterium]HNT15799.1 hypothetical protein [Verrucomicrobiota bacterium]